MAYDLLLSSGFLAFARHCGVLHAIERAGLEVDAVVGTSSGALVGALWAAGLGAEAIEAEIAARRPLSLMQPHLAVWRGAFRLDPLVRWLSEWLPPTFEELARPFAVGVVGEHGRGQLLREGPLAQAVAASCAMPFVFVPVRCGERAWQDGGAVDRLMVGPWRAWRGARPAIAHLVAASRGPETTDDLSGLVVVRTPRSGASFRSLGDVRGQVAEARALAEAALRAG